MTTKQEKLKRLCDKNGIIGALAIDQRGALRRMLGEDTPVEQLETFKVLVSKYLTKYASSILLDPELGWKAAEARDKNAGLLVAYEKTGYDKTVPGRYPDLVENVSVQRLKANGADAVKVLLYIDIDEGRAVNDVKEAFIERIASECKAEDMPFFLELVSYDAKVTDEKEYAKLKPRKVIEAMKLYSQERFGVDVLKVEVPVNMKYVEGFAENEVLYTKEEAAAFYKEQSDATSLPFIFLSAGVSAQLFQDTLHFAKESGSTFNGVLCGRATWTGATKAYQEGGEAATIKWLETIGKQNIVELDAVLQETATPIVFK
ncbi:tagatose-bisphosphate aldolase [Streptococcus anginosus]|uniref:Tagatose 1,6-diphosphate aldolase n=1 Tax=Streptococcus anginosus subsp. whileyi CCUG 39159 TaxID=1095729 RepID=I0SE32_STRAP|nr:tagatose-bisphosphate aldolase [Streptococcus anginosus]AGU83935.1 tagatose 1,6-diphosphate aldolase [Streptococcus anginosus C238]EID21635.1 tagatose-bisphosphate aldolase [Streptococcus anginosus subsp. whileyi CCUG 39159]MDB8661838.1 tagatose-bisphosphate aldolase [Streptococcus anginosus]MDP1385111.1 tagatose-bisphosphate aldolase [Streptococcus anginosus]QQT08236.1 tagatose-bisphosphate aldolase [Streptococcus anginosus]